MYRRCSYFSDDDGTKESCQGRRQGNDIEGDHFEACLGWMGTYGQMENI